MALRWQIRDQDDEFVREKRLLKLKYAEKQRTID